MDFKFVSFKNVMYVCMNVCLSVLRVCVCMCVYGGLKNIWSENNKIKGRKKKTTKKTKKRRT